MKHLMTEFMPGWEIWAAKFAGALAGSAISLAYILPKGKREAAARFMTGITAGIVFGLPVGLWLAENTGIADRLDPIEISLMGAAIASPSIWTALGIAMRIADHKFGLASKQKQDRNND